MEKLDNISKIIIATSTISYMASNLSRVNEQLKMLSIKLPELKDQTNVHDIVLKKTVAQLAHIMEDLGNYISDVGIVAPIDERVTKEAFEIVVHGKDETGL